MRSGSPRKVRPAMPGDSYSSFPSRFRSMKTTSPGRSASATRMALICRASASITAAATSSRWISASVVLSSRPTRTTPESVCMVSRKLTYR